MITTKAVMDRLPEDAGADPLAVLSWFRRDFHACLTARADELSEPAQHPATMWGNDEEGCLAQGTARTLRLNDKLRACW
jgi:hypothetical protein